MCSPAACARWPSRRAKREPVLPDVPTFAQAGVADFTVSTWYGLFAPKATPAAILDTLHAAIQAALADPGIKRIWPRPTARRATSASTLQRSPEAFTEFVTRTASVERWRRASTRTSTACRMGQWQRDMARAVSV